MTDTSLRELSHRFLAAEQRVLSHLASPAEIPRRVMMLLQRLGPLPLHRVAAMTGFEKSRVTRAVQTLERAGWVTKRQDPNDARSQRVALTERGITEIDRLERELDRHAAGYLARLAPADVAAARRILRRLSVLIGDPLAQKVPDLE